MIDAIRHVLEQVVFALLTLGLVGLFVAFLMMVLMGVEFLVAVWRRFNGKT